MDGSSDPTQGSSNDIELTVAGAEVGTKKNSNTMLMQTVLRQNKLLMSMLASMNTRKEQARWSSDVIKSLPTFSGKGKPNEASDWLKTLCDAASLYGWPETTKLEAAHANLGGLARQWYVNRVFNSWFDFEEQFERTFVRKPGVAIRWKELIDRIQGNNEDVWDYCRDKIRMCKDLDLDIEDTKEMLFDGMRVVSNDFFDYLLCRSHSNVDELLVDIMDYVQLQNEQQSGIDGECSLVKTVCKQENNNGVNSDMGTNYSKSHRTCFNCGSKTHTLSDCLMEKSPKDVCYNSGSSTHQWCDCPGRNASSTQHKQSQDGLLEDYMYKPAYYIRLCVRFANNNVIVDALVDSGSPISLIKSCYVGKCYRQPFMNNINISGINGTKLNIKAVLIVDALMLNYNIRKKQIFYVVGSRTMSADCLLGRDGICGLDISFGVAGKIMIKEKEYSSSDTSKQELLLIEYHQEKKIKLNIGEVSYQDKCELRTIYRECYLEEQKLKLPEVNYKVCINLKDQTPFNYQSQRLLYTEKGAVKDIIFDLLCKAMIKENRSEFCSSIIFVKKKDNFYCMFADLRELSKKVVKEHYSIPYIDDLLNNLRNKKYFTKLNLTDIFFCVKVPYQSSKYLLFSTFLGQNEYVRLSFGYYNSPSEFLKFVNIVFRKLIMHGKLLVYLDDLLIATDLKEENWEIIKSVLIVCNKNILELRENKCFIYSKKKNLSRFLGSVV